MQDLFKRLMSHILGIELPDPSRLKHQAIIVAHSLTPTDIARFDRRYVVGIHHDQRKGDSRRGWYQNGDP